jgi:hypothetical protein
MSSKLRLGNTRANFPDKVSGDMLAARRFAISEEQIRQNQQRRKMFSIDIGFGF